MKCIHHPKDYIIIRDRQEIDYSCLSCVNQEKQDKQWFRKCIDFYLPELDAYLLETIRTMQEYYKCRHEKLPQLCAELYELIQKFIQQIDSKNQTLADKNYLLSLSNLTRIVDADQTVLLNLLNHSVDRNFNKQVKMLVMDTNSFCNKLNNSIQQLQLLKEVQYHSLSKIEDKQQQFTIKLQRHSMLDSMIKLDKQPYSCNDNFIKQVEMFSIPTKHQVQHVYSITLLQQGKYCALALGQHHPLLLFDNSKKAVVQKIQLDKNGFYDAVETPQGDLIVGCNRNIRLYRWEQNKYVDSQSFFQTSLTTPSRLVFSYFTNSVFSTDCLTQIGNAGSAVFEWSMETGYMRKFVFEGRSGGGLCILNDQKHVMASVNEVKSYSNRRGTTEKLGRVYIWIIGLEKVHKILRCEGAIYGICQDGLDQVIACGEELMYIWSLDQISCIQRVKFQDLNALSMINYADKVIIGDNCGGILIIYFIQKGVILQQANNSSQTELLKLKSKIMKISTFDKLFAVCSFDSSFCLFYMK